MQRIAIARALVHRPRLVLIDEPTGNLDPDSAQQVLRLLRDCMAENGATGILVTHSPAAARTADRILVLSRTGLREHAGARRIGSRHDAPASNLPRVTYSNIRVDFSGVHAELDRRIGEFERRELERLRANCIAGRDDTRGVAVRGGEPDRRRSRARRRWSRPMPTPSTPRWRRRARRSPAGRVSRRTGASGSCARSADELERRKWDIAIAALLEVGKSRMEALGEAEEAIDMIRYYADEFEEEAPWQRPLQRAFANEETMDRLRPHGVFGVIAPFNYPVALSVGMLTGAILTGNTAVYKPSPGDGADRAAAGRRLPRGRRAGRRGQSRLRRCRDGPPAGAPSRTWRASSSPARTAPAWRSCGTARAAATRVR